MFKCPTCGSVGLSAGACGICGRTVREVHEDDPARNLSTNALQKSRPFWTATKIAAFIIAVLVVTSTVGLGPYYLSARSGPSCSNSALNYPACNNCASSETYNSSSRLCSCTNNAVNPPGCNRYCSNGTINPPKCDECPGNYFDTICNPQLPTDLQAQTAQLNALLTKPIAETLRTR